MRYFNMATKLLSNPLGRPVRRMSRRAITAACIVGLGGLIAVRSYTHPDVSAVPTETLRAEAIDLGARIAADTPHWWLLARRQETCCDELARRLESTLALQRDTTPLDDRPADGETPMPLQRRLRLKTARIMD